MEESVTYQEIIRKGEARGRVEGERRMLLLLGQRWLGPPDAQVTTALEDINDLERLEDLACRASQARNWHELLGLPKPQPRARRRKPTA